MRALPWFFGMAAALAMAQQNPAPAPSVSRQFGPQEKGQILAYWAQPGRYQRSLPEDARTKGVYQVRLTPEGSNWLWEYNRARGLSKVNPSQMSIVMNDQQKAWEAWLDARVERDRYEAGELARQSNLTLLRLELPVVPIVAPPDPGPIPEDLAALAGNPPRFAAAVSPFQHDVVFEDARFRYVDNVDMRPRFAYYRFSEGVRDFGTQVKQLPQAEMDKLFEEAGINGSIQRVMKAVSMLEGGFDSINTYDTGFVSVGLIQFASLRAGAGSLGAVLLKQKAESPREFESDFRRFGVDVSPAGQLIALDPETGAETIGAAANAAIIRDKRLIAVFHRAGKLSRAFRIAQLKVAKEQYYPGDDLVTVTVGNRSLVAPVSDIFRSEAGIATLMDRKVNTGTLEPITQVLTKLVTEQNLQDLSSAGEFESQLLDALKYRKDYRQDATLSQPRTTGSATSRSGNRSGRGGTKGPGK